VDRSAVDAVLTRETEYHEKLYSGFAQKHFARPAVRALRAHLVRRILAATGAGPRWRVLSVGCGVGDTEILLAPHVGEILGVDLSPAGVQQAREDAARAGIGNARFQTGTLEDVAGEFDLIVAVFLLHHLPDPLLEEWPARIAARLRPGGMFYSLDPSRHRLSGRVGQLLFPKLMAKYQSPDERQLDPEDTARRFRAAGFRCRTRFYDFVSSPLAGLLPGWRSGYRAARLLDEALIRTPGLRRWGSNFELLAWRS
jgi:cyclopropane fatty-acyl-phospholipid synthase-like methyltransferase